MNKVILVGRLAGDPEVRYTQNGKAVATFSIAVPRPGKDQLPDFVPVAAWEKLAEIAGNNLSKGRRVLVEGRLQVRSYETQEGQKRRVTEVIAQNIEFMDSKSTAAGGGAPASGGGLDMSSFGTEVFPEEEIPF